MKKIAVYFLFGVSLLNLFLAILNLSLGRLVLGSVLAVLSFMAYDYFFKDEEQE